MLAFLYEENLYKFLIHTSKNDSENEESAVFLTLISKTNETKKFLLQYADNTIHPLQSNQIDLFHFIDQDIGVVSIINTTKGKKIIFIFFLNNSQK